MNNLEFINEEIKRYKAVINITSGERKSYYKKVVNHLQQIKAELEAWEVVQEEIKIKQQDGYYYIKTRYEKGLINKEQYETIQKALEVKE